MLDEHKQFFVYVNCLSIQVFFIFVLYYYLYGFIVFSYITSLFIIVFIKNKLSQAFIFNYSIPQVKQFLSEET